ncbi:hypothetical protein Rhal01_03747 [Rubritalea halochordaticola]|uniref:Uncharacterized protein n=2 Tax=Rubritalea halochordaticola TaxID=714537 RepID=A0ABP9V4E9_9BACT
MLLIAGVVYVTCYRVRDLDRYNQLELGLEKGEVLEIFDRLPVYECRYRGLEIIYLEGQSLFREKMENQEETDYKSLNALPDPFDFFMLAFDAEQKLVAYTWCGETTTIQTAVGEAKGSHFKHAASQMDEITGEEYE